MTVIMEGKTIDDTMIVVIPATEAVGMTMDAVNASIIATVTVTTVETIVVCVCARRFALL